MYFIVDVGVGSARLVVNRLELLGVLLDESEYAVSGSMSDFCMHCQVLKGNGTNGETIVFFSCQIIQEFLPIFWRDDQQTRINCIGNVLA